MRSDERTTMLLEQVISTVRSKLMAKVTVYQLAPSLTVPSPAAVVECRLPLLGNINDSLAYLLVLARC